MAMKEAEGNGFHFAKPLLTLLQYDEDWIIRTQKNTLAGDAREIALSKANIIGMCKFSESVEKDIELMIEQFPAYHVTNI